MSIDGTAEAFALRALEALRAGNYLLCYDLADQAQHFGILTRRLQYLALLSLANAGSTEFAWRRYRELGLREEELNEDWLGLKARLLKDIALASDDRFGFERSAQAYLSAFRHTGGYFTAINAATMFWLAGQLERSKQLAEEVLQLAAGAKPEAELDRYYVLVSEAEAALLLGDTARCARCLGAADRLARDNVNARSRTRAQLALICRHLGVRDEFSRLLGLPALLYIERGPEDFGLGSGHMARPAVSGGVADWKGAFAFVPLLQPADLCTAEFLLEHGARVHLVLPCPRKHLPERWQRNHYGEGWEERIKACLARAAEVNTTHGFLDNEQGWAERYVTVAALGIARLHATRLGVPCRRLQLRPALVQGGLRLEETAAPSGNPLAALHQAAPPSRDFGTQRRFVGVLFADIAGFCRLSDEELPRFWSQVMGGVALLISSHGSKVLFRHTWGDAINVITEDATTAAELALAIQACVEEVRRNETGRLAEVDLRISIHFGPAYAGFDPIENSSTYYGSQLSMTACIEPVTPPGMIFVTEAFAACLALESPGAFVLEYAGEVKLAKAFGKSRLFGLAQAGPHRADPGRKPTT